MILDEIRKTIYGVCLSETNGIYAIETGFPSEILGGVGYYDNKLKNRYFYHLATSLEGVKGIKREHLKSINKEEVLEASDMLNKAKMFKLVKGENNGNI